MSLSHCVGLGDCICVYAVEYGGQRVASGLSLTGCSWRLSHTESRAHRLARLAAHTPQTPSCLRLPSTGIAGVYHHGAFHMDAGHLNSAPPVCLADNFLQRIFMPIFFCFHLANIFSSWAWLVGQLVDYLGCLFWDKVCVALTVLELPM